MYDNIQAAKYWNAVDTVYAHFDCRPEYCNTCAGSNIYIGVPKSYNFYQFPRSGNGMAQVQVYCDEIPPPPPPYYPYRDYLQGHLAKPLKAGTSYCVTFFVNLIEASQYAINKVGAYIDDGSIDTVEYCSKPMTFVTPQVFTSTIITDTLNWIKIEGSFIANGNEDHITIGNFFDKAHTSAIIVPFSPISGPNSFSWYLVDDVSVIETNLPADAGLDKGVHSGDSVFIGRGLDSTKGLDCKWYKKGVLVDSGAGIWAKGTVTGIDTYIVVQTICGLVKTDTVQVYTFPVGINELPDVQGQSYAVYPNPSIDGNINIIQKITSSKPVFILIYNTQGRIIFNDEGHFIDNQFPLALPETATGLYLILIKDQKGNTFRQTFIIRK